MNKIDDINKCIVCGGENKIIRTDCLEHLILEADTKCLKCGVFNNWNCGYFQFIGIKENIKIGVIKK